MNEGDTSKVQQIKRTDYAGIKPEAAAIYQAVGDIRYLLGLVERLNRELGKEPKIPIRHPDIGITPP